MKRCLTSLVIQEIKIKTTVRYFHIAIRIAEKKKNDNTNSQWGYGAHRTLIRCWVGARVGGFPGGSADKESACNVGDLGSSPGLGRSPGEGNSYPFQHSGVKNSMDCIAYGMAKSPTQLSNFHFFTFTLLGEYEWGNHSKKLFQSIYQSKTYMMYDSSIQLSSTDTCTQQYVHKYTKKRHLHSSIIQNSPKCLSIVEWINMVYYTHTLDDYTMILNE